MDRAMVINHSKEVVARLRIADRTSDRIPDRISDEFRKV